MARRFVDISVPLKAGIASDPPGLRPKIEYLDHDFGAREFEQMAGVPSTSSSKARAARASAARSRPMLARTLTRPGTITPR